MDQSLSQFFHRQAVILYCPSWSSLWQYLLVSWHCQFFHVWAYQFALRSFLKIKGREVILAHFVSEMVKYDSRNWIACARICLSSLESEPNSNNLVLVLISSTYRMLKIDFIRPLQVASKTVPNKQNSATKDPDAFESMEQSGHRKMHPVVSTSYDESQNWQNRPSADCDSQILSISEKSYCSRTQPS